MLFLSFFEILAIMCFGQLLKHFLAVEKTSTKPVFNFRNRLPIALKLPEYSFFIHKTVVFLLDGFSVNDQVLLFWDIKIRLFQRKLYSHFTHPHRCCQGLASF